MSYVQVIALVKTKSVNLVIVRWKLENTVPSTKLSSQFAEGKLQHSCIQTEKQNMVPRFCGRDIFQKMAHIQPRPQGNLRDPGNEVGPHSRHIIRRLFSPTWHFSWRVSSGNCAFTAKSLVIYYWDARICRIALHKCFKLSLYFHVLQTIMI